MLWRGHGDLRAPIESRFGDPHVIRGDDYRVQILCATATIPNVPKKRFVCNKM
jgi:hypothetical protein